MLHVHQDILMLNWDAVRLACVCMPSYIPEANMTAFADMVNASCRRAGWAGGFIDEKKTGKIQVSW